MYQNVSYWMRLLGLAALIGGSQRLKQRVRLLACGSSFGAATITVCLFTVPCNISPTSASGFAMLGSR
jgi:hypothetical protein